MGSPESQLDALVQLAVEIAPEIDPGFDGLSIHGHELIAGRDRPALIVKRTVLDQPDQGRLPPFERPDRAGVRAGFIDPGGPGHAESHVRGIQFADHEIGIVGEILVFADLLKDRAEALIDGVPIGLVEPGVIIVFAQGVMELAQHLLIIGGLVDHEPGVEGHGPRLPRGQVEPPKAAGRQIIESLPFSVELQGADSLEAGRVRLEAAALFLFEAGLPEPAAAVHGRDKENGFVLGHEDVILLIPQGDDHRLGLTIEILELEDDRRGGLFVFLGFGLVLGFFFGEELFEIVLVELGRTRLEEQPVEIPLPGELGETVPRPVGAEKQGFSIGGPKRAAFVVGGIGQPLGFPGRRLDGQDIRLAIASGRDGDEAAVGGPGEFVGETAAEIHLRQPPVVLPVRPDEPQLPLSAIIGDPLAVGRDLQTVLVLGRIGQPAGLLVAQGGDGI